MVKSIRNIQIYPTYKHVIMFPTGTCLCLLLTYILVAIFIFYIKSQPSSTSPQGTDLKFQCSCLFCASNSCDKSTWIWFQLGHLDWLPFQLSNIKLHSPLINLYFYCFSGKLFLSWMNPAMNFSDLSVLNMDTWPNFWNLSCTCTKLKQYNILIS